MYVCNCSEDDSIIPDNLPQGYTGLVVDLWIRHEVERASGDDALVMDSYREPLKFPTVEDMESSLVSCLSVSTRVNLPLKIEDMIIEKVVSFANSMLKDTKNAGKKVLPIVVEVVVRTLQGSMENEQEAIARAFIESADALIREFLQDIRKEDYEEALEHESAFRSKVKAVEYVTVPDSYLGKHCMLCSDEFSAGVFVARMPVCYHVYHGDCILRKLVLGDSCPICPLLEDPCTFNYKF